MRLFWFTFANLITSKLHLSRFCNEIVAWNFHKCQCLNIVVVISRGGNYFREHEFCSWSLFAAGRSFLTAAAAAVGCDVMRCRLLMCWSKLERNKLCSYAPHWINSTVLSTEQNSNESHTGQRIISWNVQLEMQILFSCAKPNTEGDVGKTCHNSVLMMRAAEVSRGGQEVFSVWTWKQVDLVFVCGRIWSGFKLKKHLNDKCLFGNLRWMWIFCQLKGIFAVRVGFYFVKLEAISDNDWHSVIIKNIIGL